MSFSKSTSKVIRIVALAVCAALLVFAAFHYDSWVREHILAMQGKGWKRSGESVFYGAVSRFGDWPWLMALGAVGWLLAWMLGSRDWKRILITAMIASTLAGALANTVRLTSGRTRPSIGKEITPGWYGLFHGGKLIVGNPKFNAFPSGHTATAVGFAGVLLFSRPFIGLLAMVVALGIGWSRMQLGAHNLSDVAVGALLALLVAWICWRVASRNGDKIAAWLARRSRSRS